MAIRKSMQERVVVSGAREEWLQKCVLALESSGFSKVIPNQTLYQINAQYHTFMTWGSIVITLTPSGQGTEIAAVATSNADNIQALFKSPNMTILSRFKDALR